MPACLSNNITALYAPQFEQFDLALRPDGMMYTGDVSNSKASGSAWVIPISGDCAVVDHYITPTHDMMLAEYTPEPYACVTEISEATLECMPKVGIKAKKILPNSLGLSSPATKTAHAASSVCTFLQADIGCEESPLLAGHLYHSRAIMFFDSYFEGLNRQYKGQFSGMFEDFNRAWSPEASSAICTALHRLSFAHMNRPGAELYVRSLVENMVAEMALARTADAQAFEMGGSRASQYLVQEATALIERLLDEGHGISLAELAERLYVSRSKLCAVFKQETGESIGAYVRRRRIECAQELLKSTNLTVAEIAMRLGYSQQAAFNQAFKQATGSTPTAWRNRR